MPITQENRILSLETPLEYDHLLVKRLRASEGISQLFRIELELLHEETETESHVPTSVDPQRLIGQPMKVRVIQPDDTYRYFHGICNSFSQGNRNRRASKYRAEVVPKIWLLTQMFRSRIFQQTSIPDILKEVFEGFDVKWEIQGTFHPRNYCVQYRESDWDFASRLMEEEGIFYFFKHTENAHQMVVANTPQSHLACVSKSELPFTTDISSIQEADWAGSVHTWRIDNRIRSGKYTLWDSKFELPFKHLETDEISSFNIGGNQDLEIYDYPGRYAQRFDGIDQGGGERPSDLQKIFEDNRRTVRIRQQEIDVAYKNIYATSDCCALAPGFKFDLQEHPTEENNRPYLVVTTHTEAIQAPAYFTEDNVSNPYVVSVVCMPHGRDRDAPFRPLRQTPKPILHGSQTAFVVGPPDQEIFTDKYGRVKVQFQWDRQGRNDSNSSCWIRVAQGWAGKKWGSIFLPRIGMEVMVDFLEGDPDQPIIIGAVYNAEAMPPYTLPDEKTKSTIKSNSSVGGQGFNEFRIEDKKGHEQIFIHGEKDMDIRIKNDERHWIKNDHHFIVNRDRREKIVRDEHRIIERDQIENVKRDLHLKIEGKDATDIGGSLSLKVGGAVAEKFGASHSEETTGSIYLKAGTTIVLEASAGITLKVGGSFVSVNAGGVQIQGPMVMINSGGAALAGAPGVIVPPLPPSVADPADDAVPGSKIQLEQASAARKEKTFKESSGEKKEEKKNYVAIVLKDEADAPVAGERYQITLPDGSVTSGSLDEEGRAEVRGIDPGTCKITFPDLDEGAWE